MASVLLIDDEPKILSGLRLLLKPHFSVITTTEPEEVFRVLQSQTVDVLVSDQRMPHMQGVEVLRKARQVSPQTVRVLLTGYADLNAVVGAVNEGEVYRYLQKPWDNKTLLEQITDASKTSCQLKEGLAPSGTAAPGPREPPMAAQNLAAPAAANDPSKPPPVLAIYDPDPSTAKALNNLTEAGWLNCEKVWCNTLEELTSTLSRKEVAALLADFSRPDQDLERLLRLVKREAPAVQTLLASRDHDVNRIMHMVNETRPYRFLTKPLDRHGHILSVYLASAFAKYAAVSKNSALQAYERADVDEATAERDRTFFASLGAALKAALFGRFFRGSSNPR